MKLVQTAPTDRLSRWVLEFKQRIGFSARQPTEHTAESHEALVNKLSPYTPEQRRAILAKAGQEPLDLDAIAEGEALFNQYREGTPGSGVRSRASEGRSPADQ